MRNFMTSERTTALVSASLALAILAAMGTAESTRSGPNDVLASLESDLRFQLELAWRPQPRELKKRLAELDGALDQWRSASRSAKDRDQMIGWLQDAIEQSLPGRATALPPAPVFNRPSRASDDATAASEQDLQAAKQPAPPAVASPPSSERPTTAVHSDSRQTIKPPLRQADRAAAPPPSHAASPIAAPTPPGEDPGALAERPATSAPPTSQSSYAEPAAPPSRSAHPSLLAAAPVATPLPPPADDKPAPEHSVAVLSSGGAQQGPIAAGEARPRTTVAAKPVVNAAGEQLPSAPPAKPIEINLVELNARIGGYHDGLEELNAALVADKKLNTLRLTRLVSELEELASHHEFIRLYYYALSEKEKQFVIEPQPLRPVVELAELQRVQLEDSASDFLTTADGQPSKLAQRLQKLLDATPQ
ncbi:MAG: hypothetical protein IT424_14655 [Pirellulales bacterium]|nr:hypothetical protein [Pirellulales bacterium]